MSLESVGATLGMILGSLGAGLAVMGGIWLLKEVLDEIGGAIKLVTLGRRIHIPPPPEDQEEQQDPWENPQNSTEGIAVDGFFHRMFVLGLICLGLGYALTPGAL